jgi:hypothetical protein
MSKVYFAVCESAFAVRDIGVHIFAVSKEVSIVSAYGGSTRLAFVLTPFSSTTTSGFKADMAYLRTCTKSYLPHFTSLFVLSLSLLSRVAMYEQLHSHLS